MDSSRPWRAVYGYRASYGRRARMGLRPHVTYRQTRQGTGRGGTARLDDCQHEIRLESHLSIRGEVGPRQWSSSSWWSACGTFRTSSDVRSESAIGVKAVVELIARFGRE